MSLKDRITSKLTGSRVCVVLVLLALGTSAYAMFAPRLSAEEWVQQHLGQEVKLDYRPFLIGEVVKIEESVLYIMSENGRQHFSVKLLGDDADRQIARVLNGNPAKGAIVAIWLWHDWEFGTSFGRHLFPLSNYNPDGNWEINPYLVEQL